MTRQIVLLSIVTACLTVNSTVLATVRLVPSQYPTIQSGIDAAVNGDVVIVEPNTYTGLGNRDIDFKGKAITVRSTDPNDPNVVAATIIYCEKSGRGFMFNNHEDEESIVSGFTITNGYGDYGGGIYCIQSSPTIANCILNGNQANYIGGAMRIHYSSPTIENCIISHNGDTAVYLSSNASPAITNCLFINNTDLSAIYTYHHSTPIVNNCTFVGNVGCYNPIVGNVAGAIHGSGVVTNSIFWDNWPDQVLGCSVTYSCVQGGYSGTGNISDDPLFVTGPLGDYYLSQVAAGQASDSPCVNMGSDTAANLGMYIYTTRTDEVGDKGFVDMGYHYPAIIEYGNPDIDGDGDVDFFDYAIFASQWKETPGIPSADIAPPCGDDIVDGKDLALLVDSWLWGKW